MRGRQERLLSVFSSSFRRGMHRRQQPRERKYNHMNLVRSAITTQITTNSIGRFPLGRVIGLISLVLMQLALSPSSQASRGGPDNTATGVDALHNITTGAYNTADGYRALFANTTGNANVAAGS